MKNVRLKPISIYTDGSSMKNGDPQSEGSFSYVVVEGANNVYNYALKCENTTNNRMEMSAVLFALLWAFNNREYEVSIFSDSQYVVKTINGEYRKGKNLDIWKQIDLIWNRVKKRVKIYWIRGHNGNMWNELADKLCSEAYKTN